MNQDNPFAKGVSINQDMLTDDWQDAIDSGNVRIVSKMTILPYDPNHDIDPLRDDFGVENGSHFYERPCFIENNSMTQQNRWFYYNRFGMIYPTKGMKTELSALGREEE